MCSHPKIPDDEDGDDDDDDDEDNDDEDDDNYDDEKDEDHHPCLGLPHLIGTLPPAYLWHRPSSHHLVLTIKTTRSIETIKTIRTVKTIKTIRIIKKIKNLQICNARKTLYSDELSDSHSHALENVSPETRE